MKLKILILALAIFFLRLMAQNSSVYLGDDGEIKAGSRNRELTLEKDNAGFYKYILEQDNIRKHLEKHPTHRLYGEFLVPHSLKTYRDVSWLKGFSDVYAEGHQKGFLHGMSAISKELRAKGVKL